MMEYRKANMADAVEILHDMRKEQIKTVARLGIDTKALLEKLLRGDPPPTTVIINGHAVAMYGVVQETLLGEAKIWMLATTEIKKNPIAFLRASRNITHDLYLRYGPVIGMVDSSFEQSQRWLRWIGFKEVRLGDFIVMRYSGGH
jgi:cytochrome c biogenesis protein ResB